MLRTLIAAVALTAAVSPALADGSRSYTYCGWQQGVYVCQNRSETANSVSSTICGSGGYDAACSTITKNKEPDQYRGFEQSSNPYREFGQ